MTVRYRIHPAIGIARVGDSVDDYFIGPEAPGVLPILNKPDASSLRPGKYKDPQQRIKRQGARFRIYAYTEDPAGVWDFALGCMRSYLILAEKARRFHDDPDITEALAVAQTERLAEPTLSGEVNADSIAALRRDAARSDEIALGAQGYGHERLDQLVTELLLGVR